MLGARVGEQNEARKHMIAELARRITGSRR